MSGCFGIISEGGDPKNSLDSPVQFGAQAGSKSHPLAQAASEDAEQYWPWCQLHHDFQADGFGTTEHSSESAAQAGFPPS